MQSDENFVVISCQYLVVEMVEEEVKEDEVEEEMEEEDVDEEMEEEVEDIRQYYLIQS